MTRSPDEDFYESREWLELRYRVLQKSNGQALWKEIEAEWVARGKPE